MPTLDAVRRPGCADYKGYSVCKANSWTQGPFLLKPWRSWRICRFDYGQNSANYTHAVIEALKLGLADRTIPGRSELCCGAPKH